MSSESESILKVVMKGMMNGQNAGFEKGEILIHLSRIRVGGWIFGENGLGFTFSCCSELWNCARFGLQTVLSITHSDLSLDHSESSFTTFLEMLTRNRPIFPNSFLSGIIAHPI